jgi:long-chain acyl-CoA synthetase
MAPALPPERRTIYQLLKLARRTWADAPALHQPTGQGGYRTYSFVEYQCIVEELAAGLRALGVKTGDIVGIAAETRAELYFADVAAMVAGGTSAVVYTALPPAEQVRTLRSCQPIVVFAENPKTLVTLEAAGLGGEPVHRILLTGKAPDVLNLDGLRALGRQAIAADPDLLSKLEAAVRPSDYAILYLTSGATGEPKMGLVTHNSCCANVECGPPALPLDNADSALVFLPSAHITQRLVLELLPLRMGYQIYFSEGLSKMPTELRTLRPTFFVAPPRVWERIYTSITTEIRKKPAMVRKMFYMGLGVGSEAARARLRGQRPSPWVQSALPFFDRVVFAKIRERLGGRLRLAASGAAPLGKSLAEFYASIGMPLTEGYGLTEGGVTILNPVGKPRPGSIGLPLKGSEHKLADDGELLIRGEMIFSGYYKDPEATASVLRDGWLHTGDIAEVDADGYYYITGRKKELIVSSNGKKIFPARIEALFLLEPLVNQVLLVGDRMPYMSALITVNPPIAAALKDVDANATVAELARHPSIQAEIKRIIQQVNRKLASFEQIRRFRVLDRDFSIEAGELTPTMKVRRARVLDNFRAEISTLYSGREDLDRYSPA